MHLLNWKCANQCRLLTTGKIEVVSMYKERSRGRREVKEGSRDMLILSVINFVPN